MQSLAILALSGLLVSFTAGIASSQTSKPEPIEIRIGYLRAYEPQLALSVLDVPPRDEGVAGAEVAIGDNNTTGGFLGQEFVLDVTEVTEKQHQPAYGNHPAEWVITIRARSRS